VIFVPRINFTFQSPTPVTIPIKLPALSAVATETHATPEITPPSAIESFDRGPDGILWEIFSLRNIIIILAIISSLWIVSKFKNKQVNVALIWIIVPAIRILCSYMLISLIEYMIIHYIDYSRTWGRFLWIYGGTAFTLGISYLTIQLFLKTIHKPSTPDIMQQYEFAGTPVPGIGSNLPGIALPKLFLLKVIEVKTSVSTIDVKVGNLPVNSFELQLKPSPGVAETPTHERKTAYVKIFLQTRIIDTYLHLKNPLKPEDQGKHAHSISVPKLEEYSFEQLRDKAIVTDGKTNLKTVIAAAREEIAAKYSAHGIGISEFNLFDPNEPDMIIAERNKSAADQIKREELNAAALTRIEMAIKRGEVPPTIEEALHSVRIDDQTIKVEERNFNSSNSQGGRGRKGKKGKGGDINVAYIEHEDGNHHD
jgi:phosphate/sulfate permease